MSPLNITLFQIGTNDTAIKYTGDWFLSDEAAPGGQPIWGTNSTGSHATFVFNGTFVAAYGPVDESGTNFTYTIDGEEPVNITLPGQPPTHSDFALFSSPQLNSSEHTLVISNTQKGPTLWLDYITYVGSELQRRAPPVNTSDTAPLPPSQPSPPSSSASSTATKDNTLPAGTIVLIVLCVILFIVVLVIAGVMLHRRKHRWQMASPANDMSHKDSTFEISPPTETRRGVEAIRVKLLARLKSRSRTHPGMPRQPPPSSTLFTSVIMPPESSSTSRRWTLSTRR